MTSDDTWRELNAEFYAESPTRYFRERLTLMALRAAKPSELDALVGEGLSWGQSTIRIGTTFLDSSEPPEIEQAAADRFTIADSQILLHHAAETALRYFLAHEELRPCPWLEMAGLRHYGKFKAAVAELATPWMWEEDRTARLEEVFFGRSLGPSPTEQEVAARDATRRFLGVLADRVLDDAFLYNSAKHGMTMIGGMESMSFMPTSAGIDPAASPDSVTAATLNEHSIHLASGHTATFLERDDKDDPASWHRTTRWINSEQEVLLAGMALTLIDTMRTVARWRYLGIHFEGLEFVQDEAIDLALQMSAQSGPMFRFRRKVATERT